MSAPIPSSLLARAAGAPRRAAELCRRAAAWRAGRRFARADRGAALVEFGLVVPILTVLMCAIIDFSLAMFTLNNLTTAVREGARLAAVQQTLVQNDPVVVARVQQQIALSFAARSGVTPTVTVNPDAATGNITVTVSNYTYVPVTPLASAFRLGTVQMQRTAVFRWERFTPPT